MSVLPWIGHVAQTPSVKTLCLDTTVPVLRGTQPSLTRKLLVNR